MALFDPKEGQIVKLNGTDLLAAKWRTDLLFMMYYDGSIRTFSSSLGKVTGALKMGDKIMYELYPYGSNYMVGVGVTSNLQHTCLSTFRVRFNGLEYRQSLTISTADPKGYSSTFLGDSGSAKFYFDWRNRLVVLPLWTS